MGKHRLEIVHPSVEDDTYGTQGLYLPKDYSHLRTFHLCIWSPVRLRSEESYPMADAEAHA